MCVQVCSFQDGSVGVYDLRKRSWDFLTEEAHTETIFDCVFKPDNRDHLATVRSPATTTLYSPKTNHHKPLSSAAGCVLRRCRTTGR